MKVSILVILVVLPMLGSIGLYGYGFLSTHWTSINHDLILKHSKKISDQEIEKLNLNKTIQFEYQLIPYEIRTRYGLFGYCYDTKWLNFLTIKSSNDIKSNSTKHCPHCGESKICCPETNQCVKQCDNKIDCPSHIDEKNCIRNYHQINYYWKEGQCIWHSLFFDIQNIPRWLSSYFRILNINYDIKLIRYYIMLILFFLSPILTFISLIILYSINCINRFYSIPFGFVSCFTFSSFLSGISGLGIFLYDWYEKHLYEYDKKYNINDIQQSIIVLNSWINNIEYFGLTFWIIIGAIGLNLFTSIISCCFFCGLQSEKSKLRIYINNEKYAIVHTNLYDE